VGRHSRAEQLRADRRSAGGDLTGRHVRARWSLPLFAVVVTAAFVGVISVTPTAPAFASAVEGRAAASATQPSQSVTAAGQPSAQVGRDSFSVSAPPPPVAAFVAPAAGTPDPGTAQAIAYAILQERGLGADQYGCLVSLWNRESHWNVYAANPSGAYGIPQALPGSKMASAGADWETNPATQIIWGLGYIESRYGTPCGAWQHSEDSGWY